MRGILLREWADAEHSRGGAGGVTIPAMSDDSPHDTNARRDLLVLRDVRHVYGDEGGEVEALRGVSLSSAPGSSSPSSARAGAARARSCM